VFRIDLETNQYGVWLDLTDEVNNAGDKGILGVEVHPNFKEVKVEVIFPFIEISTESTRVHDISSGP
jgi:hypothetical protein